MRCVDRDGTEIIEGEGQKKLVKLLYQSVPGRVILRGLTKPWVSKAAGRLLDSRLSVCLIPRFIKANKIDPDDYEERKYRSFNEFFTRKIKPERRKINRDPNVLIAPCDGRLTVYDIDESSRFQIKGRPYTMEELLKNRKLAKRYHGGKLLLFRLTVGDYHRYCYPDSGIRSENYMLPGILHTVHPIAAHARPIYKENTRTFSLLKTERFKTIRFIQVGALLVGRIVNRTGQAATARGQEAGMFQYGGSTVILCMEPDVFTPDEDILRNSKAGAETVVRMGSRIGCRKV